MSIKHVNLTVTLLVLTGCHGAQEKVASPERTAAILECLKERLAPVKLNAGLAVIGHDNSYPEERPVRIEKVAAFEIDAHEVTNGQFSSFIEATNFVMEAEKNSLVLMCWGGGGIHKMPGR